MDFNIDVPNEIKPKIMEKLIQNGILKSIKRRVKMGMMIAVQEIRDESKSESYLERKIFKNADPYELKALQSIFNFLATYNLNYTLSTLLEESAVRRNSNDTSNIMDLIDDQINHPEVPVNNYVNDEDLRYYEENPQSLKENKAKSNLYPESNIRSTNYLYPNNRNETTLNQQDIYTYNYFNDNKYISNPNQISINNDFINNIPSSNYENAKINSNYSSSEKMQNSNNRNDSMPNLELQGFKISRRTFERNPFIISIVNL